MNKPNDDPTTTTTTAKEEEEELALDLDEGQLAQLDQLIEEHATTSRRLTREEMLQILVEKGIEQLEQGTSLLPYLKALVAADEASPTLTPDDTTTKH